jgi:hypothetical protein
MNPCIKPEGRQIVVAIVKSTSGIHQRIELFTVADMVHLFAIAMGYKPEIAFSLGVISRSSPDVQSGQCDLTVLAAKKALRVAELINNARVTKQMPETLEESDIIHRSAAHVHGIESAYAELCETVPGIEDTFAQQYKDWASKQNKQNKPPTILRRMIGFFRGKYEQEKHS